MLHDLDLYFQGQTFQTLISSKHRAGVKMRAWTFIVCYLSLDCITVNAVLGDLDLNVQGQTIEMLISLK